jgi:hypothetical protein
MVNEVPAGICRRETTMSNHFTGLRLGPPEGDTRLDFTDLYAFQAQAD